MEKQIGIFKVKTDSSGKWVNIDEIDLIIKIVISECVNILENIDPGSIKQYQVSIKNHFNKE